MLGSLGAGCRKMLPTSIQWVVITGYYILYYHTITPGLLLRLSSQVYQYAEPTRQKIPAIHQPDLVTSNHPKKSVINPLVEQ
jgi:hypothetical protein